MLRHFFFIFLLLTCWSCSNIDCPLDSVVNLQMGFYNSTSQQKATLTDTLSIYGLQGDSLRLLYNKAYQTQVVSFSLNPAANTDTLVFRFSNATQEVRFDTLIVQHKNQTHFESLDCPAAVFHRLQQITHTAQANNSSNLLRIDSVHIANPKVQYEDVENIKCYFSATP